MQKIIPHLWYDKEAKEAADFYATVFPDSKVTGTTTLRNTPSGDTEIVTFEIMGHQFMAISAGPYFKLNPAISFMVNFDPSQMPDAAAKIDEVWNKLAEGGKVLMPIQKYPFSERYGWIQDRFGLTWQLILTNPGGEPRPAIIPSLMFTKENYGKVEEAASYWASIFKNAKVGTMNKYPAGMEPDREGAVMFGEVMLEGQWFAVMESAREHGFTFNEAVSLLINCEDQAEIDHYWQLSAVPASEQCGWLKDKYCVSWQVSPAAMNEMMSGTPEQVDRVTQAFLPMKKLDLAKIRAAYEGK